jgi:hypothetical protein
MKEEEKRGMKMTIPYESRDKEMQVEGVMITSARPPGATDGAYRGIMIILSSAHAFACMLDHILAYARFTHAHLMT